MYKTSKIRKIMLLAMLFLGAPKAHARWECYQKMVITQRKNENSMTLIEIGNKIIDNKPFTQKTAAKLNSKLEAIMGHKNPLGLNAMGLSPTGGELNHYIGKVMSECGRLHAIAKKDGTLTPENERRTLSCKEQILKIVRGKT
jgi:hypothetical protein